MSPATRPIAWWLQLGALALCAALLLAQQQLRAHPLAHLHAAAAHEAAHESTDDAASDAQAEHDAAACALCLACAACALCLACAATAGLAPAGAAPAAVAALGSTSTVTVAEPVWRWAAAPLRFIRGPPAVAVELG